MARRFNDQIDRLFAELIHEPWRRSRSEASAPPASELIEIEVPVEGVSDGEVSITVAGDRLAVAVLERNALGSNAERGAAPSAVQRSVMLPSGARLVGLAVSYDDNGMRVRIRLEK